MQATCGVIQLGVIGSDGGGLCCGLSAHLKKKKKKAQMVKRVKTFTGSWARGYGAEGDDYRLWRLLPNWFWNDWSEVTEVMAVG